jgi:hypothetical protein
VRIAQGRRAMSFPINIVLKDQPVFKPEPRAKSIFETALRGGSFPIDNNRFLRIKFRKWNRLVDFVQTEYPAILACEFTPTHGTSLIAVAIAEWDRENSRRQMANPAKALGDFTGVGEALNKILYHHYVLDILSGDKQPELHGHLLLKATGSQRFGADIYKNILAYMQSHRKDFGLPDAVTDVVSYLAG